MNVTAELVAIAIFATLLLASAIGVIYARSPMYAAMSLVAAFVFQAGLYVLLSAHLLAFMQILVYAGAVMVLFLFVIMLLSLGDASLGEERQKGMQVLGALGAIGLVALVAGAAREVLALEPSTVAADGPLLPGEGQEGQVGGVEHELDAHHDDEGVALDDDADEADAEEDGRQEEVGAERDHQIFSLATTTAPTMATRRRMLVASKGSRYCV